jgi:Domain of unknown function (DUF1990)
LRVAFKTIANVPTITQTSESDAFGNGIPALTTTNSTASKFLFQKQEKIEDFGLDIDIFKYRMSDSQIGRLWAVDPLASKYPHNSVYALQENKFGLGIELEGLELENFNSQFKKPSELPIKVPNKNESHIQVYSSTVENSKVSFNEMKQTFMKNPEKLLSNSKAEFHAPENSKGEKTGLTKGNTIEIEIAGPQNDSYVKVHNVVESKNKVSATFVTLEGHVEKGVINFTLENKGGSSMSFTIGSMSQLDYGAANSINKLGDFSKNSQKESWKEVLNNYVKTTNGTETKRVIK